MGVAIALCMWSGVESDFILEQGWKRKYTEGRDGWGVFLLLLWVKRLVKWEMYIKGRNGCSALSLMLKFDPFSRAHLGPSLISLLFLELASNLI